MTNKQLDNRVKKLQGIEAQMKELEAQAEAPCKRPRKPTGAGLLHQYSRPARKYQEGSLHMNSFASIVDIEKMPTTDELYEAALFVEDAAAVANILVGVSMSEGDKDRVLGFLSRFLCGISRLC